MKIFEQAELFEKLYSLFGVGAIGSSYSSCFYETSKLEKCRHMIVVCNTQHDFNKISCRWWVYNVGGFEVLGAKTEGDLSILKMCIL